MAALREGRASTSGLSNGNSTPMAATPRASTPRANGRGGPRIAEGVQQALLYVRFRTAAESGLKGQSLLPHLCLPCNWPLYASGLVMESVSLNGKQAADAVCIPALSHKTQHTLHNHECSTGAAVQQAEVVRMIVSLFCTDLTSL